MATGNASTPSRASIRITLPSARQGPNRGGLFQHCETKPNGHLRPRNNSGGQDKGALRPLLGSCWPHQGLLPHAERRLLPAGFSRFPRFAAVHGDHGSRCRIELRHLAVEINGQPLAPDTNDHALMPHRTGIGLRRGGRLGKGENLVVGHDTSLYLGVPRVSRTRPVAPPASPFLHRRLISARLYATALAFPAEDSICFPGRPGMNRHARSKRRKG